MRAPLWLILLLVLATIGLGVYAYFTTPLPLGLSGVIRTPGGANVAASPITTTGGAPAASARTVAGQPLVLGSTNVVIQSVQRNQELATGGRGPVGTFTLVQLELQNFGSEPLTPQESNFRLLDDRGRVYAVDPEATRAINVSTKHRSILDATVPPGGRLATVLAFETAADASVLSLRVTLGSGEVELPR